MEKRKLFQSLMSKIKKSMVPPFKFFFLEDGIYYEYPTIGNRTEPKKQVSQEYVKSLQDDPNCTVQIIEKTTKQMDL